MTNDHMADEGGRGMSEHTPGPWHKRQVTGTCDLNIMGKDELVCTIPYKFGPVEKRAANAVLILAAPQLKAALERADALCRVALPTFDWGKSALTAEAIQLLNEVPGEITAALKAANGGGD